MYPQMSLSPAASLLHHAYPDLSTCVHVSKISTLLHSLLEECHGRVANIVAWKTNFSNKKHNFNENPLFYSKSMLFFIIILDPNNMKIFKKYLSKHANFSKFALCLHYSRRVKVTGLPT